MRSLTLKVNVGDTIEVGRFRNVATKITDIKKDENGQPIVVTSNGSRKMLSFRLNKLVPKAKDLLKKKTTKSKIKKAKSYPVILKT
ncbi:MAG: hypothetical protein CBE35_02335 [Candidatus Pelagibacter sp. TMED275]|jgi:hypothetical protein|nr:MAG: hypothetical protein CBE35_02335 [Candidatus Pelagibacter sp. TMED275]